MLQAVDKIVGEETDMPCKEVVYAAYKVPVVSNRDVSIYCSRYSGTPTDRNNANSATALSYSIMHPNIPQVKGFVRGNMNVAQTIFTAVDGGRPAKSNRSCTWTPEACCQRAWSTPWSPNRKGRPTRQWHHGHGTPLLGQLCRPRPPSPASACLLTSNVPAIPGLPSCRVDTIRDMRVYMEQKYA